MLSYLISKFYLKKKFKYILYYTKASSCIYIGIFHSSHSSTHQVQKKKKRKEKKTTNLKSTGWLNKISNVRMTFEIALMKKKTKLLHKHRTRSSLEFNF